MARTYTEVAEPRYVERAKTADEAGTNVVANPTLVGTEALLDGLQIDEVKYKVGAGANCYSGTQIVYDNVGYGYLILASSVPTLKTGDLYFITSTYTSNGQIINKGEVYKIGIKTGNEFEVSRISATMIEYEEILAAKGDLISMNLDGTSRQYRVIKMLSGSVAEVVAMFNSSNSQQFAASGNVYAGSELDTYLNSTWYDTLNATAKAAIVDKTFKQDSWYLDASGNPDYTGYSGNTKPGTNAYTISLGNAAFGAEITRHVYALSMQDVLDYALDTSVGDGLLQNYNLWKLFWGDEVQHSGIYLWLRSADASSSPYVVLVGGTSGTVNSSNASNSNNVRSAFQIDLSKISFTKV